MSADPTQPPPPPEPTAPLPGQPAEPPGGGGRSVWVVIAIVFAILVVAGIAAFALQGNDDEPATTGPTGTAAGSTGATGPTHATGSTATGSTGATGDTGGAANLGCSGGPPAPDTLPDGRYFGYVESLDPSSQTIAFDLACFYSGEEANRQAAARGDEVPVPNDVYIVNDNTKVRTLDVDPDADLVLIDWNACCEPSPGATMQAFASAVDAGDFTEVAGFRYAGTLSPYWVTIGDGQVVEIEEQFLP